MTRHSIKTPSRRVAIGAGLGICLAFVAGCTGSSRPADTSTIVVGQTQDIIDFNPYSLSVYSYSLQNQIFDTLIRLDDELEPQARLAESWEFDDDMETLTLHLRENVTFHDGTKFTADDVIFSIEHVQDPDNGANIRNLANAIEDASAPDETTVVIQYAAPNPAAFDLLNLLYIASSDDAEEITTAANGTGPYALEDFNPGQGASLTRFNDYWDVAPEVENVDIKILPDEATAQAQLRTGAVTILPRLSPQNYASAESDPSLTTGITGVASNFLSFDVRTTEPPLDDPRVRQALSLALDRDRIATEVVGSGAQGACLPYPEASIAYHEDQANSCAFDLDAARQLLEDAGVSNLSFEIQTSSALNPGLTQMSEIFQADLLKIGVDAQIRDVDDTTYRTNERSSQFELHAHIFGRANADPATLFGAANSWSPDGNPQGFRADEYSELVQQAATTIDEAERAQIYQDLNDLLLEQNFVIVAAPNQIPWAANEGLAGVDFTLDGLLVLSGASY